MPQTVRLVAELTLRGKGRERKGREGKGREGKGKEGKEREGKGREGTAVGDKILDKLWCTLEKMD
jgi:hypothetical protein